MLIKNKLSKIPPLLIEFHREILIAFLCIICMFLIIDDRTYGGKNAKEWHNLFAETKTDYEALKADKTVVFNKLVKLEECVKAYDYQHPALKESTSVNLYCTTFFK